MDNSFEASLRSILRPDDGQDVVTWMAQNIKAVPYSPMPGPFRATETPWLVPVLRAAVHPEVRLVVVSAPIQSGKSMIAETLACYIPVIAPGPTLLLQDTDANARDWHTNRVKSLWDNTPETKERIISPEKSKWTSTQFRRMTMWTLGAHNLKNLQRRSIRWLIGDECWLWPKGHMAEASARVTAFGWLGKRIFLSQGAYDGDDFTESFNSTDRSEWTFCCPACGYRQPYVWEQVIFPTDFKDGNTYNYNKVGKETKYKCISCDTLFEDTDGTRMEFNATGEYVSMNGNADPTERGFHWNALCCRSWGKMAVDYLHARESLDMYGDEDARRIFKQKQLALPWSDEPDDFNVELQSGGYKMTDDWDNEGVYHDRRVGYRWQLPKDKDGTTVTPHARIRVMTVDVQRQGFYCLVRSWSIDGTSRLFKWAYVNTWEQVKDFQDKCGCHPAFVFVDSGDQTDDVYRQCIKHKWNATKGSHLNEFRHTSVVGGMSKSFLRPWSVPRTISLVGGTCKVFLFSNLALKDTLSRLRRAGRHTYAVDAGEEYSRQMTSEYRSRKTNGKPEWVQINKRANHLWDCEVMSILAALRLRLIGKEASEAAKSEVEEETESTTESDS